MVDSKALTATNCWKERWCLPYWVLCFGELSAIFLDIRWMMIGVRLPCCAPLATGYTLHLLGGQALGVYGDNGGGAQTGAEQARHVGRGRVSGKVDTNSQGREVGFDTLADFDYGDMHAYS